MSRIQVACYSLLASAFLLAGLLFVQVSDRLETPAEGAMVVTQQHFTLLTAKTRDTEEALFVMDDNSGLLLVYKTEVPRGRLSHVATVPIGQLFRGEEVGGDFRARGAR